MSVFTGMGLMIMKIWSWKGHMCMNASMSNLNFQLNVPSCSHRKNTQPKVITTKIIYNFHKIFCFENIPPVDGHFSICGGLYAFTMSIFTIAQTFVRYIHYQMQIVFVNNEIGWFCNLLLFENDFLIYIS